MRDFDIGSAVSSAASFVGEHLRLILLLAGGALLIGQVLLYAVVGTSPEAIAQQITAAGSSGDASQLFALGGGLLAASLVATLLQTTAQFAIFRIALSDEQDLGSAIGYGTNAAIIYLLFIVALSTAAALVVIVLVAALVALGFVASSGNAPGGIPTALLVVILLLLLLPLGIWLMARLLVAVPAMADARTVNPVFGLTQSWKLTQRHQWPMVGYVLLYIVAAIILQGVLTLVSTLMAAALGPMVGGILGGLIVGLPVTILGLAVAYGAYDRLRTDNAGEIFG